MTHDNGDIKVVKSDGTRVDINLDKIHIMVSHACKNCVVFNIAIPTNFFLFKIE